MYLLISQISVDRPNLTNAELADEEISEDQESCFTEDGMEDLYDDESYLDDEDENGLADVETDYDEDKYNEKIQKHVNNIPQRQHEGSQSAAGRKLESSK